MAAVVTLLFTDLVGSTEMLDRLGDDEAEGVRRTHFRILREAVAAVGGEEVKNLGDGLMVAFESPVAAVECAVRMQRGVERHNRARPGRRLTIRVGLNAGEPIADEDDYFGSAVVVAKRLCDAAAGGDILVSDVVRGLVGSRARLGFEPLGPVPLKGLREPMVAFRVVPPPREAAPAAVPTDPRAITFVGRRDEVATLDRELDRAAAGRLRVVLVAGEAGIGKTRLVGEFLARRAGEAVRLSARAYPLGATASLGLWVEALEGHLRALSDEEVVELCGAHSTDLAALLPALADAGVAAAAAEPPRVRLLGGLANLLARLADEAPVAAVLDDVQWADGSSWEALGYLARNLAAKPILLVLAARPGEVAEDPVAAQTLLALEQEGFLTRLTLAPLPPGEVRELARAFTGAAEVADTLVDWLMERSQGTPLFAAGLLRSLMDEGADLSRPQLRVLPEDLTERVTVRLRDLDAPSRAVLEMLTVVGARAAFGELELLCGQPLERLAELLDGLVRTRIVTELETARDLSYEVSHPLYQEALYRSLSGARRRALHRHVARALVAAGRPGPAAAHFVRSSDPGDPEAIDALRDALAQAEARELHREALTLLSALLELLPAGDRRWLEVHGAMARAPEWIVEHRADTEIDVALEAMRRIDGLLGPGSDPAERGAVKLNLAVFTGWGRGDTDTAIRLAAEAEDLFDSAGDVRARLLSTNEIGYLHWIAGDMTAFGVIAAGVLAAAEAGGDRFVVLQALCAVAHNRQLAGDLAGSLDVLDRAVALAREDAKLYRVSYLLGQRAYSLALLGRPSEAREQLEDGKAANPAYRATVLSDYAMQLAWLGGDLAGCVDIFTDQLAWTGGHSRRRALGACVAAISAAERGDRAGAAAIAAPASAVTAGRDARAQSDQMRWATAIGAWLAGDAVTAAAELTAAVRRQRDGGWGAGPFALLMLADLAEVSASTGDAALAATVEDLCPAPGEVPAAALGALARFTRTAAGFGRGDAEGAATAWAETAEVFNRAGWPLLAGRALALAGRAAARSGQRQPAVAAWSEALARFEACGATVRHQRALEDLRRLGARGRRLATAVSGPAALTRREREAARLAVTGLSSREIAEALFISERTVESHLGSAYAKLGVKSRLELVRLAPDLS